MSDTITQDTLQVDALNLFYRELSPMESSESPPVILLHGFPTSSYLWRNIMPLLASKRRVIAQLWPLFTGRWSRTGGSTFGAVSGWQVKAHNFLQSGTSRQ